ncbi:prephenate dehydrogenase/arogenate dehydrogenase family protein [Lactobacillus sp. Sy-1]|uniref:prephenate dehydrogenase n=1 Tax=Lactobacillus sp. Sy-1 TaxID=2109645 RepID=UPI001C5BC14E|nr:prephenate dehydrogenase/arogenate dehydrogenase family protein [Lactobacillus sp. Sy-1]MBW1606308.1 prephenate dehydrogenase/arogenate dehydrogenase family protein [Lactobacillus sp. Sy-1]
MPSVFINGLGLIGSSIARLIKVGHPDVTIIGNDANPKNAEYLLEHQIIDRQVPFNQASKQADVIILATPVNIIVESLKQLGSLDLKPNTFVTDVGSSKQKILSAANQFVKDGGHFIGGHPMAGSHLTGSENGSDKLLANHTYFLANLNASDDQVKLLKELLSAGNFNFQAVSSEQHDRIVSAISYLPHVVAFSLINTVGPELTELGVDPSVPAGGLLDTTRVAMSDPNVWTSILSSSSEDVVEQIEQFEVQLQQMKAAILNNDKQTVKLQIESAKHDRQEMEDAK